MRAPAKAPLQGSACDGERGRRTAVRGRADIPIHQAIHQVIAAASFALDPFR